MKNNIVPEVLLTSFGSWIKIGYDLSRKMKSEDLVLSSEVGEDAFPHYRRAAIDFVIHRHASTIGGEAKVSSNKNGTSHHVEFSYGQWVITVSHLASINGVLQIIPRMAEFRKSLAENNPDQLMLFSDNRTISENTTISESDNKIYAVVTHEGKEFPSNPTFKVLKADCTTILYSVPIVISKQDKDTDVNIIDDLLLEFKEQLKTSNSSK